MPSIGDSIDRFVIEAVLGEGGMGRVYRVFDPRLGRRVALKVLLADGASETERAQAAARMEREARAAAAFNHPNVVAIYDVGEVGGSPYIAMELVSGRTLRTATDDVSAGLPQRLGWLLDVARGLGAAHRAGLVHRDIKPDNVMITTDGVVKVLDFGIARRSEAAGPVDAAAPTVTPAVPTITAEGVAIGTPRYMAPEQIRGEPLDGRADQFAWGVMAFEVLAGRLPWDDTRGAHVLLAAVLTAPAPDVCDLVPTLDPRVGRTIARALEKTREARFPSMEALVFAIEAKEAAAGVIPDTASSPAATTTARPVGGTAGEGAISPRAVTGDALESLRPGASRKRVAWVATALGFVLLVAGLGAVTVRSMREDKAATGPAGSAAAPNADEVVVAAEAKIKKGDYATAIDALTELGKANPDRADVHMLLEQAYTGAHDAQSAMREADLWLRADPKAATYPHLQEDVRNAALVGEVQDGAFRLLETRMGMRGIDILYDIAYGKSGSMYPQAMARAKRELDSPDLRKRASPALAVLMAFRNAKTCDEKHALLEAARDEGDSRLLGQLEPYESAPGCMRQDHRLEDARQAILDRAKAQGM